MEKVLLTKDDSIETFVYLSTIGGDGTPRFNLDVEHDGDLTWTHTNLTWEEARTVADNEVDMNRYFRSVQFMAHLAKSGEG